MAGETFYVYLHPSIKGGVTEQKHKDWIDVQSYSFGLSNDSSVGAGTQKNRVMGSTRLHDITFSRLVDQASPQIMQTAAEAKNLDCVKVEFVRPGRNGEEVYHTMKFENCVITSWQQSGHGGSQGSESISINFVKVENKFTPFDEKGKPSSPITGSYDASKAVVS